MVDKYCTDAPIRLLLEDRLTVIGMIRADIYHPSPPKIGGICDAPEVAPRKHTEHLAALHRLNET
jgi:hypothetical protein